MNFAMQVYGISKKTVWGRTQDSYSMFPEYEIVA